MSHLQIHEGYARGSLLVLRKNLRRNHLRFNCIDTAKPGGFTLIEIMIVISLMALMLAAGIPTFVKSMRKSEMTRAVNDVLEGCQMARSQAILQGRPFALTIRAEGGHIGVQPVVERDPWAPPPRGGVSLDAPVSAATTFSGQLPDNIAVTFLDVNFKDHMKLPEARVRFFPNGTSDEFTIVLDSKEGVRKISLEMVTGLTDLQVLR